MDVDFGCNACHHRFGKVYKDRSAYIDATRPACPKCKSTSTRRVIAGAKLDIAGLQAVESKFDAMYPRADRTLPPNLAGARCVQAGDSFHRQGISVGTPIIENKAHERNICAQHGYRRI